jgi:WD40 repeat protein
MQGDTAGMNDVAFSPDGHLIIGVGVDVWIWDAHTYRERASLRGHRGQINALAIHPNGKSLLTVSDDGTLRTWQLDTSPELAANYHFSLPTEQELGVAPNKQRDVLAFDTDGTLIRASGIGDHVWLWQPETGSEIRFMREVDGGYESAPIFLSPNGQLLIAGNRLWNTATGFPIDFWQSWDYQGLSGPFSAGGNHIIDVGYNKIDIYDAVTGDMLASHQMDGEITNLFAATERPLLVIQTGQDNNDVVWDYETDTLPAELNNTSPVEGTLRILAMGDTLALDTATHLIDLRNGDAIAQLSPVIHPSAASFSPHDRWVTVGDFAVWNIATQTRRDDIQPPYGGELALLAFSPSDDMLYAVNVSGAIYRWRLE